MPVQSQENETTTRVHNAQHTTHKAHSCVSYSRHDVVYVRSGL